MVATGYSAKPCLGDESGGCKGHGRSWARRQALAGACSPGEDVLGSRLAVKQAGLQQGHAGCMQICKGGESKRIRAQQQGAHGQAMAKPAAELGCWGQPICLSEALRITGCLRPELPHPPRCLHHLQQGHPRQRLLRVGPRVQRRHLALPAQRLCPLAPPLPLAAPRRSTWAAAARAAPPAASCCPLATPASHADAAAAAGRRRPARGTPVRSAAAAPAAEAAAAAPQPAPRQRRRLPAASRSLRRLPLTTLQSGVPLLLPPARRSCSALRRCCRQPGGPLRAPSHRRRRSCRCQLAPPGCTAPLQGLAG